MECFGREEEAKELWRRFNKGENILMLAPRRIGKTFLLDHLRDTAGQEGYRVILLDVQGKDEEKEFFSEVCSALQERMDVKEKMMAGFSERLSRIVDGNWKDLLKNTDSQTFADHLFAYLNENKDGGLPWLILVDELPIMILAMSENKGGEAIRKFLSSLRKIQLKYKNIRWIFAGSIGLDTVARRHDAIGTLNELHPFTLLPFDKETTKAFCQKIAKLRDCTVEDVAIDRIIKRLGWLSPYYLERIIEDACTINGEGTAICIKVANQSMEKMLTLPKKTYWSAWEDHLNRNFAEPERSQLYKILETVAQSGDGVDGNHILGTLNNSSTVDKVQLRNLLNSLISDGYLDKTNTGKYHFRMNLLREWWLEHVVI